MTRPEPRYRRILLKLSGEALAAGGQGFDAEVLAAVADDVRRAVEAGVQVGLVVGGGNIFRGLSTLGGSMNRALADSMGMLATMINALALQDSLERHGVRAVTFSAVSMPSVCERFTWRRAIEVMESGAVALLGGGTGNPYFTTDTAACLRALEVRADVVMKATKVDGVYDKDPMKHPEAVKFDRLTHRECLERSLAVMDTTAISLCMENDLPILVFNMLTRGNILRAVQGEPIGTVVSASAEA